MEHTFAGFVEDTKRYSTCDSTFKATSNVNKGYSPPQHKRVYRQEIKEEKGNHSSERVLDPSTDIFTAKPTDLPFGNYPMARPSLS